MVRRTPGPSQPRAPLSRRLATRLGLVALLAGLALYLLFGLRLDRFLTLHELGQRRQAMQVFVRAHPVFSLELYAGAYALVVALSLPGALVMSLAGGYFFGVATGAAAAVGGMTVGAGAMYLVARTALGDMLAELLTRGGAAARAAREMRATVERDGFVTLLTLRLIPGVPFALVNVLAGVVRLSFGRYLLATILGVTPSTLVYAWMGQGLGRVFGPGAPDLHRLIGPQIYGPLILLAMLAVGPLLFAVRRRRAAMTGEASP